MDSAIGQLTYFERYLFFGFMSHCDDAGHLLNDPLELVVKIAPYDYAKDTHGVLNEYSCAVKHMETLKLIDIYEVDGKKYIGLPGFAKHQVIGRPSKPQYPRSDGTIPTIDDVKKKQAY